MKAVLELSNKAYRASGSSVGDLCLAYHLLPLLGVCCNCFVDGRPRHGPFFCCRSFKKLVMDQMFRLECRFYIPLIPCQAVSIQYSWADNQKCLFFISPKYLLLIVSGGFERKCVHYGILTQKCFYSELKHQFSLSEHLKTFYAVFYIFRGRFKCFVFVQP